MPANARGESLVRFNPSTAARQLNNSRRTRCNAQRSDKLSLTRDGLSEPQGSASLSDALVAGERLPGVITRQPPPHAIQTTTGEREREDSRHLEKGELRDERKHRPRHQRTNQQ